MVVGKTTPVVFVTTVVGGSPTLVVCTFVLVVGRPTVSLS